MVIIILRDDGTLGESTSYEAVMALELNKKMIVYDPRTKVFLSERVSLAALDLIDKIFIPGIYY